MRLMMEAFTDGQPSLLLRVRRESELGWVGVLACRTNRSPRDPNRNWMQAIYWRPRHRARDPRARGGSRASGSHQAARSNPDCRRRTRTARLRAEQTAIERRLERAVRPNMGGPVLGRSNIAYELSARTKATGHGGIGVIAKVISEVGLADEIDSSLELLKLHKPYYESDHVLNIAYNALCGTPAGGRSRPGPPRPVPRAGAELELRGVPATGRWRRSRRRCLRRSLPSV